MSGGWMCRYFADSHTKYVYRAPYTNTAKTMNPPPKGKTGVRRIWHALLYSLAGLSAAFRHESAFRQEVLLAVIFLPLALLLDVPPASKAMLIVSVMLVLIVELLNSAIEAIVDRVSLELHPLAKRAKDIGSAAVFLSLLSLVLVWALVLWGRYGV